MYNAVQRPYNKEIQGVDIKKATIKSLFELLCIFNCRTPVFISDRYSAIRQAIESANEGDTILLLGKGDEDFMYHENGRVPWKGDHNAARECIRRYYFGENSNDLEK